MERRPPSPNCMTPGLPSSHRHLHLINHRRPLAISKEYFPFSCGVVSSMDTLKAITEHSRHAPQQQQQGAVDHLVSATNQKPSSTRSSSPAATLVPVPGRVASLYVDEDEVDSAQFQMQRLNLAIETPTPLISDDFASHEISPEEHQQRRTLVKEVAKIPLPVASAAILPARLPRPTEVLSQHQEPPHHPQQQQTTSVAASREQFLVFIKILFKILDQAQEVHTRNRAKKLVAECTRKNREGDPNYTPLMDAVQERLRLFVGEAHWRKAMLLLRHYYQQKLKQQQPR